MEQIKKEITKVWEELGRDPSKLKLDTKSDEELTEGLEKLQAIKFGLRELFSKEGNHNLGIEMLANVFGTEIQEI